MMRPIDIDRSAPIWLYRPSSHKTAHIGKIKVIPAAKVSHWFPYQCRRLTATMVRAARGIEDAPALLGHSTIGRLGDEREVSETVRYLLKSARPPSATRRAKSMPRNWSGDCWSDVMGEAERASIAEGAMHRRNGARFGLVTSSARAG